MAPSLSTVGLVALLAGLAAAQKPVGGSDNHPAIKTWRCTNAGGCVEQTNYIVLDSATHPTYQAANRNKGCGDWGNAPPKDVCPDKESCAENCVMEAIKDYSPYGVETDGSALTLTHLIDGKKVSPRVYLLDEDKKDYELLRLTGNEFTFDVDTSKLPCGMNGALYLSEMRGDGGRSELNTGGPAFGTGYCDAQCFTFPFVNGEGNIDAKGACCGEMDIWEANSRAIHVAPHPCNITSLYECTGEECAFEGVCDKNGCAWNPYRVEQDDYYGRGPSFDVDTTRKFTVVTSFPTDEDGKLVKIVRSYVQDGRLIRSEVVNNPDLPQVSYLDDDFCEATGSRRFMELGAHESMGESMARGAVLAMSIWWAEDGGNMLWMDGASQNAGPCNDTEGNPSNIVKVEPNPYVVYSNMKWGEIGSTWKAECQVRPKLKLF